MPDSLDFAAEAKTIAEELKSLLTEETFSLQVLQKLQSDMDAAIKHLDAAMKASREAANKKAALKRLRRSMGFTGALDSEDFIAAFEQYTSSGLNRSRTIKTVEDVMAAQDALSEVADNMIIKDYLLTAYNLIMSIRDNFKEHIEYRVFIMGKSSEGQDMILMGSPSLEDMVSQSNVSSTLGVQLELTTAQLKEIINEYEADTVASQWQQFNDDPATAQAWQVLLKVRDKILAINKTKNDGKKIYYSFGQLIEALVYLQNKTLSTANIFEALRQGKNTVSFEIEGDFRLEDVNVQSKAFSTYDSGENDLHRIRLMNLSGVWRVLDKIRKALFASTDFATLQKNLSAVFENNGKEPVWNVVEDRVKQEIETVLSEFSLDNQQIF